MSKLSFKAYAITDYGQWTNIEELYRTPPQIVIGEIEGFMKELFEIAQEHTKCYHTIYHWITIVAYDRKGMATVACDYQRRHPTSTDYWYGNDINYHIAKL